LAAILGEEGEQRVHGVEARGIDHRTAVSAHGDQSRSAQAVEMKSERIRRETKRSGDFARGHPLRSGLYQQTEYVETIVLGERGQSRNGVGVFHTSTNIEILAASQLLFQPILKYGRRAKLCAHATPR